MKRVSIGIKGVDEILNGGFPEGKAVLVSGNCGAGKTIFASHFINEGLRSSEAAVYISLEQEKEKLLRDLEEIGIQWSDYVKRGKLSIIGGNLAYVHKLKDKRKAGAQDIIQEIIDVVRSSHASRVTMDSVNLFLSLFETTLEQRNCFVQLNFALLSEGCTVVYTCEIPEYTTMLGWYGFEEFVVDGVLLLRRNYARELNQNQRFLEVVKMRGTAYHEGCFPLRITKKGMEVFMNDPNREFFH